MAKPKLPQCGFMLASFRVSRQELQQAAARNPTYGEPYYLLGKIYKREDNEKKAERA